MIGQVLAERYRVLEKLGEGATGEVYLVEHLHLARKEALKVLHARLGTSPELVSRFRREARATNRLQHPNIVGVYDFGQLPDERFFLTTEYAEGEALDARLVRRGLYAVTDALGLIAQIASAIDHAHARGVIHRDLKPANMVIVERAGGAGELVKILDFGIAKIIAPDYRDSLAGTDPNSIYGTPAYMAPEQVKGVGSEPRIDLYALGCIAFEMLVGTPPFVGSWVSVMHAHLDVEPPSAGAEIPRELDAIIRRCLDKDPDRRFQTGKELGAALEAVPGYPATDAGGGRRSWRNIPRSELASLGFDTRVEVPAGEDRALDTATQTREAGGYVDLALQAVLRTTAEALIDSGCRDVQLTVSVAEIADLEGALERLEAEADELQRRIDATEQRAREYESSLRFAIGEIRFECQQTLAGGEAVADEIAHQLARLEQRLEEVMRDAIAESHRLTDRAIGLAGERDEREQERARLYRRLDRLVADLEPRFAEHGTIKRLSSQLQRLRYRRDLLG